MRRSTMLFTTSVLVSTSVLAIVVSACGGSDPPPATQPSAQPYGAQPYPQQGGYGQQGGYAQPQPQPGYPQPQPTMAPTGAAPAGTMAVPGPLALACQNDSACGFHRCNTQYQKCAFPCQTPVDCAPNNQCLMGVCAPKAPGAP